MVWMDGIGVMSGLFMMDARRALAGIVIMMLNQPCLHVAIASCMTVRGFM